jgi:DNA-directed RNA polymerase specialized sigma24 family protein
MAFTGWPCVSRGTPSDAEEVVQDTLWTASRKIGTFRGAAAFGSWVYRITANAAYQKLRGRRRGLPNPEIAQMLHANLGTVKSRVHRARLFLRGRLANYMGAGLEPSRS